MAGRRAAASRQRSALSLPYRAGYPKASSTDNRSAKIRFIADCHKKRRDTRDQLSRQDTSSPNAVRERQASAPHAIA